MKKKTESIVLLRKMRNLAYNSTFVYPLVIKDGQGCYIEDIDGENYLDFTSNISSCPLGYGHPEIKEIINKFGSIGIHKIAGQDFYCKEHIFLAEKLLKITIPDSKVFFINSGAEAVENAIKLAYRKKGPLPGISCFNAFHGRTLGALSFTFSKEVQKTNFPEFSAKRIKFCTSDNDPEISSIEKLAKEYKISFIIVELIQGEGGINVASKKFANNLNLISKKFNIPLIIDEVQTGLARTGKWWAYQHYEVNPDIISIAKALQVGAVVFNKKFDPLQQGVLSSTWGGGSRIDMAIGTKIIEIIKRDNLISKINKNGNFLKKYLLELKEINDTIIDVKGIGLMLGIEVHTHSYRNKVIKELFKRKLLVLPSGTKTIRILPPLIITQQEILKGLEIFEKVLKEIKY
jgi:4-aminobutyrate aminotransferase